MSDTISAKWVGYPELMKQLSQLSEAVAKKNMEKAALAGSLVIQNKAKTKAPRKTGNLRRSIHSEVVLSGKDYVRVEIGTNLIYAAIQEYGGEIKTKNGKFLAIPLTKEAQTYGPRDFPGGLHPLFKKGGRGGILEDDSGTAQYALVKKVTIPPHPYLRPAFDEGQAEALQVMTVVLGQLIDKAAK